ncbi:MAG: hypothetical protein K8R02_04440 [Anaerohalosphaeraceae bacterium]|nr:hypothetical protein [Anaerohalosphaeraceae bacterium]
MQILAKCPNCRNNWLLDAQACDRRVPCPSCKKLFKVPKLAENIEAVKLINQSRSTAYIDMNGKTYG